MPNFTIKGPVVGRVPRNYTDKFGPKVAYPIVVVDEGGIETEVDWTRKPESPAPVPGQKIQVMSVLPPLPQAPEGALPKLNKVELLNEDGTPVYQGSSDGAGSPQSGRQTHPVDAARMGRSAAQKAAGEFIGAAMKAGIAPNSAELQKWHLEFIKYTDAFEQDVLDAASKVGKEEDKPAEASLPRADAPTNGSDHPF